MPETNWDDDGPVLTENLQAVLEDARRAACARESLAVKRMARWHVRLMQDLVLPNQDWAGCFRGSGAAAAIGVRIGDRRGTPPAEVAAELDQFESRLAQALARLDARFPDATASEDALRELLTLCAWVHGEWARIHPFVNGNGRTARLWVNAIAMRYGVPPFMRLRPRPGPNYEWAAARAMDGDWKAITPTLHRMLDEELKRRNRSK